MLPPAELDAIRAEMDPITALRAEVEAIQKRLDPDAFVVSQKMVRRLAEIASAALEVAKAAQWGSGSDSTHGCGIGRHVTRWTRRPARGVVPVDSARRWTGPAVRADLLTP